MSALSDDFTLAEFTRSQTAARMGRSVTCVTDSTEYANLVALCTDVLQPLRDSIRRRVIVTSGYRPQWLNSAIGGALSSAHIDGRAADIIAAGMSARDLAIHIAHSGLPFDQCILEFDQWVHVSIADPGEEPRRQVLTASVANGEITYEQGL